MSNVTFADRTERAEPATRAEPERVRGTRRGPDGPQLASLSADAGRPLDPDVRRTLEHRFGRDLSSVRVHTDDRAASVAASEHADAVTVGSRILFAPGRYAPHEPRGLELLAHEVAHTVQQEGASLPPQGSSRAGLPYASAALEAQADAAARVATRGPVVAGAAGRLLSQRAVTPVIARRDVNWQPIPGGSVDVDGQPGPVSQWESDRPDVARFNVPVLTLPREKGPVAARYRAAIAAGGLESTVHFPSGAPAKTGLWQSRASTPDLHRRWLAKVGWPSEQANALWFEAGGRNGSGFPRSNPGVNGSSCDMDHIVELQLGGTNVPGNVTPLNSAENQASGREIWQTVSAIARQLRSRVPASGPVDVILSFQSVQQVGGDVAPPSACAAPGHATTCTEVDCCAPSKAPGGAAGAAGAGRSPYAIVAGAQDATFQLTAANPASLLDDPNVMAAEAVPGMILSVLNRQGDTHTIDAFVESSRYFKRSKNTRVPIVLQEAAASLTLNAVVDGDAGRRRVRLVGNQHPQAAFTYPYLSTGRLNFSVDERGLSAEGHLQPSLPLLRRARIDVRLADGVFEGRASIDPDKIRLPGIPQFRATRADVTVALAPSLNAGGSFAFEIGRWVEGEMQVNATEAGLTAEGSVRAKIPHVERAEGTVRYRQGRLTGDIVIRSEQLASLPGRPRGEVRVGFDDSGIHPTGQLTVQLPGGDEATLDVSAGPRGFIFTGRGRFSIPGLRPVTVSLTYDGERFSGEGGTEVTYGGLTGSLTVRYNDGRFSGRTTAQITRGRVSGSVTLNLSEAGNLFGEGSVRVQITDSLAGRIGIQKPEHGPLRVSGELELPPRIVLFQGVQRDHELFRRNFDIPILGFSVGSVSGGIIARVTPAFGYRFSVGPGTIENARVAAGFNPLEDNTDFELRASATLLIPASASLWVSVRGAVGVSVAVASLTGGITVRADAGIEGRVSSAFDLHYRAGKFTVTNEARAEGSPFLALSIDADITAEALGGMYSKVWNWHLADFRWGSGLTLGVIIPLRYASDEPFRFPAMSDIRFIAPDLDFNQMLPALAQAANR